MTDRDATLRLDAFLDGRPASDAQSDPLVAAASTMHTLDLQQRATPSDAFRTQLRQSLFPSSNGVHHLSAADEPVMLTPMRPTPCPTAQPKKSHRLLAIAAALVLLIGGLGVVTRLPLGNERSSEPSAIPAAFANASPAQTGDRAGVSTGEHQSLPSIISPLVVANDTVYLFRTNDTFTGLSAERTADSKPRWQIEGVATGQLAVDQNAAYVAFDGTRQVNAYDTTSGNSLWSWTADGSVTGLTVDNGAVYVAAMDGTLTALTGAAGSLLWQSQIGPSAPADSHVWGYESIVVSGGSVVALMPSGTLGIVNAADGMLRGSGGGYDPSATAFTVADGAIVIVDRRQFSSRAEATSLPDDAIVEHTAADGVVAQAPGTVLPDGTVALPPVEGWAATGIDLATGATLWTGGFPVVTTPPVAIGNVIAIGAEIRDPSGDRPGLVGIDPRTGETTLLPGQPVIQLGTWRPEASGPELFVSVSGTGLLAVTAPEHLASTSDATPIPSDYDGALTDLFPSPEQTSSILSAPNGDESGVWLVMDDGQVASVHPDVLNKTFTDQMATVAAESGWDGAGWALDAPEDALLPSSGYIATQDGVVYQLFGGSDGTSIVRAVDLQSGDVRWERSVDRWVFVSDVTDDAVVLAGTTQTAQGDVYDLVALDRDTGEALWNIPLTQMPRSMLVDEDLAFVLEGQDQLSAYDLATQQLVWSTDLDDASGVAQGTVPMDRLVGSNQLAVVDGTIGVVISSGQLVTVDAATGEPRSVSERTNPGLTEMKGMDDQFVVIAHGAEWNAQPTDATPMPSPVDRSTVCQRTFSVAPDDALPNGTLIEAFDPATGDQLWSLGTLDGAVFWALDADTLHGYAPITETASSENLNCAIDVETGAITQTGATVPASLPMFRMVDTDHPDDPTQGQVIAILADGAWLPVTVDPDVAASLPVFDRDIEDYGGAFNVYAVDGSLLIVTFDGTLIRIDNAGPA